MIVFYGGLSCFHSKKKYISNKQLIQTVKGGKFSLQYPNFYQCKPQQYFCHSSSQALAAMKEKGEKSSWNYQCKIHLLEAEVYSATDKKDKAKVSYNAAIAAARSSKFIHEQGLACELAALHYLKCKAYADAVNLFKEAKDCYTKWGSEVKVDSITKQLEKISAKGFAT